MRQLPGEPEYQGISDTDILGLPWGLICSVGYVGICIVLLIAWGIRAYKTNKREGGW
jgi:hypothetical protein